jgi:hypothetical protein
MCFASSAFDFKRDFRIDSVLHYPVLFDISLEILDIDRFDAFTDLDASFTALLAASSQLLSDFG